MSVETDKFVCVECGEDVPIANKLMHAIQCERHSQPEAVLLSQKENLSVNDESSGTGIAADETESATTEDSNLNSQDEPGGLPRANTELLGDASEQKDDPASMLVTCEFCEIEVPLPTLNEHAYSCGNRTDVCETCMCYVRLCDFPSHLASGCAVGATASAVRPESQTEQEPLLQPSNQEPYHRERQVRRAEPEIPRWAPVVIAAVGVGAAVAFSAMVRRR